MADVETAIGAADIMQMLGWCRTKFYMRCKELERLGVIFYTRKGHPPRKVIRAFPSRIIKYCGMCGKKDTPI